jgi:hypothetical protein
MAGRDNGGSGGGSGKQSACWYSCLGFDIEIVACCLLLVAFWNLKILLFVF